MKTKCVSITTNKGAMAEWSKAVDLSSTIFGCAGSNPAGTKLSEFTAILTSFMTLNREVRVRIPVVPLVQWCNGSILETQIH